MRLDLEVVWRFFVVVVFGFAVCQLVVPIFADDTQPSHNGRKFLASEVNIRPVASFLAGAEIGLGRNLVLRVHASDTREHFIDKTAHEC